MAKPSFEQASVTNAPWRRLVGVLFAIPLLAAGGWLAVHAASAHGGAPPAAPLCTGGAWTAPQNVATLPAGTFLRTPSLAGVGETFYVAGSPIRVGAAATGAATPALLVQAVSGGDLGAPHGPFQFLNPRLLSGDDGKLLLIWGEAAARAQDTLRAPVGPAVRVASLWYASHAPKSGWTPPARLYSAPSARGDVLWNVESVGTSTSNVGRVELLIPRINGGTLRAVRAGGSWHVDTLLMRAHYATLAVASTGESYGAYIGTNPTDERQRDALLFARATKEGRWETAVPIEGAHTGVTRPRLLIRSDGVLFLLWGLRGGQSFGSDAVRVISSSDRGATWSQPRDLPLPREMFTKWRPAIDGCGAVHVVVSTWEQNEVRQIGRVLHASLGPDGWTRLAPLTPAADAREIFVEADASGVVRLLSSVRVDASAVNEYEVRLATFRAPSTARIAGGAPR